MTPHSNVIVFRLTVSFSLMLLFQAVVEAQQSATFLTLTPDARSAAMGEAGVASSPDVNATFWNVAKLGFVEKDFGASVSYTPWLRSLTNDMWLGYASAYKRIKGRQVAGISTNYFHGGNGNYPAILTSRGKNRSYDLSINASYSYQFNDNFSAGLMLKYIRSYIPPFYITAPNVYEPGQTAAGDGGIYYKRQYKGRWSGRERSWSLGAVLANIGGILHYGAANQSHFTPMSLNLGGAYSFTNNGRHRFNFILDARKSLVPIPAAGVNPGNQQPIKAALKSFTDAPDGFGGEVREVTLAGGAEYLYANILAARAGYSHEHDDPGGRKFFTAGAGIRLLKTYHIDFAYLIPTRKNSPLAQTLRLSVAMYLNDKDQR
jgi:hypothetical protein